MEQQLLHKDLENVGHLGSPRETLAPFFLLTGIILRFDTLVITSKTVDLDVSVPLWTQQSQLHTHTISLLLLTQARLYSPASSSRTEKHA